jgi:carbonic anhydrase
LIAALQAHTIDIAVTDERPLFMRISRLCIILPIIFAIASPAYAGPDWSYDGMKNGQDNWAMLSPEYAQCELGKEQSPIIIGTTEVMDLPTLNIRYGRGLSHGTLNPVAAIVSFNYGQRLLYDGVTYHLKHLVIHSPAEHVAKGKAHMLEFQFLHVGDNNKRLILSLFGDLGNRPPPALDKLIKHIPQKPGDKDIEFTFNPGYLLPDGRGYYIYEGSETNPPCSEGVTWIILKQKMGVSKAQLRALTGFAKRNARQTQPTYFRTVKETRDF